MKTKEVKTKRVHNLIIVDEICLIHSHRFTTVAND